MNWQKFIGVVMASSAGSYIVRVTDTDLKILACLINKKHAEEIFDGS